VLIDSNVVLFIATSAKAHLKSGVTFRAQKYFKKSCS